MAEIPEPPIRRGALGDRDSYNHRPVAGPLPEPSRSGPPPKVKRKPKHRYRVETWVKSSWRRRGWAYGTFFKHLHEAQAQMHRENGRWNWWLGDHPRPVRVVDLETNEVVMGLPWPLPPWAKRTEQP